MKKTFKLKTLALSLAVAGAASVAMVPAAAQAGVSANVGVVTDYIFRGFNQSADGTGQPALQGGLDFETDMGLYAGVWASTMDKEYEYDLYAGWAGTVSDIDLGIAYTNYSYTDKVAYAPGASSFEEINTSIGYGPVTLAVDFDVDPDVTNYIHYAVSYDASAVAEGVSLTYGVTKTDKDGGVKTKDAGYLDVGYATTLDMGVDLTANFIMSDAGADDTSYLVIGMSKSFDLM
ncbi:hypothetical protein THMIRHAM_18240 [Thiomicrorhabdus immobilis]|uniref:Uncharacterized protein n=1 Tax=Thiomicrorhabdus immobilis TaxID=2791037 RepID=A0ABN6D269_9GAMM|nr:TorF family putative porin [Thiomicrorhabdus immobilis]BCN94039.1 hypothetical protein THMIRHAM_18240 [Thiomicrorhabdus immobilis]